MNNDILLTSGYNFEGYSITEYLGVFSGECALDINYSTSAGTKINDFWNSKKNIYCDNLKIAKDKALEKLIVQVGYAGGNAIIGTNFDYNIFSNEIMIVVANGTAVKVKKNNNDIQTMIGSKKFLIEKINCGISFRPVALMFNYKPPLCAFSLDIFCPNPCDISAVLADIIINTIFDYTYIIDDIEFLDFVDGKINHLVSSHTSLEIPLKIIRTVKSVDFKVKKYVVNNNVIELPSDDLKSPLDPMVDDNGNEFRFSLDSFLKETETLKSVKEIYTLMNEYNKTHAEIFEPALIEEVKKMIAADRTYGGMKDSCIRVIRNFFE